MKTTQLWRLKHQDKFQLKKNRNHYQVINLKSHMRSRATVLNLKTRELETLNVACHVRKLQMTRGINPAALLELVERFNKREVLYMSGLTRFQFNELINEATAK